MAKSQADSGAPQTTTTQIDAAALLDQILDGTGATTADQRGQNKQFIEAVIKQALQTKPGSVVAADVERTIKFWQAQIDQKLSSQLNEILHDPAFQKLEGTWRGMHYLVSQSETSTQLKIKVLNTSKRQLYKDLENATEFDQNTLFKKVYEAEYGQLGGNPFGLLMGDYEFDGKHPEDVDLLQRISGVAAAAHAPFVAAAGPDMFDIKDYTDLNTARDLAKVFDRADYTDWRAFRENPDSRYAALCLPRVLARLPWGKNTKAVDEFAYEEGVDGTDHNKYLWMNASWAYAARVTDAFAKDGWFMRTRGVEGGGKVEGLPVHVFTEAGAKTIKCPTEVLIPDRRENELSELGFLPLLHCKNTNFAAFLGTQTVQKPKKYFDADANANAEMSTKLNYMMCVSRFAHYLKVMARDKVGSFAEQKDMERWLNDWINHYVIANPEDVGDDQRARAPLRAANVSVTAVAGKPGWYQAVAHLRPHFQLEGLNASMRLVAELPQRKQ